MDKAKIKTKSLEPVPDSEIAHELELVNKHTVKPLTREEVYLFKVILCDNDVDRVGDKMTDNFLEQFANISKGLTGLKDHDWESDNQMARLYDTEVVTDENDTTVLGEPRKYVLGKAYTLTKYRDYIDKINAGLLKEVSVSFESVNDKCSICGQPMKKDFSDVGSCEAGHTAGETYDGKLCYCSLNELKDSYEWSLVAVPCQRNSGIKNKNIVNGGLCLMKKSKFMLQRLMASKAFKEADEETQKGLQDAIDAGEDADLSEEDINALIDENSKLKEEVQSLKDKVREAEGGRTHDKIEAMLSKAIDELNPLTPVVKENMLKEVDIEALKLGDDGIEGLDKIIEGLKERYKGLCKELEEKPEEKPEEKGDEQKDDEDGTKNKGLKHNSGISFGVSNKSQSKNTGVKTGISFN